MPKILVLRGTERGQVFNATIRDDDWYHVQVDGCIGDIHKSRVMVVSDDMTTDDTVDILAMRDELTRDRDLQRRLREVGDKHG